MLIKASPSLPIVVLTNTNDDETGGGSGAPRSARLSHQAVHETRICWCAPCATPLSAKQAEEALRDANEVLEEGCGNALPSWKRPTTSCATKSSSASTFKNASPWPRKPPRLILFEWHIPSDQVNWSATGNPQHPPTKGPEFGVGHGPGPYTLMIWSRYSRKLWQTIQDRHGLQHRVPHSGWE